MTTRELACNEPLRPDMGHTPWEEVNGRQIKRDNWQDMGRRIGWVLFSMMLGILGWMVVSLFFGLPLVLDQGEALRAVM